VLVLIMRMLVMLTTSAGADNEDVGDAHYKCWC